MVDVFLPRWRACVRRTEALIDSASAIPGDFRPLAGYRSIDEQIAHIIAARYSIARGLRTGDFGWREEMERVSAQSLPERLESARSVNEEFMALLADKDDEWLSQPARELPRDEWLWALLEHETHHAGQLSMMIRMGGGSPAQIFE